MEYPYLGRNNVDGKEYVVLFTEPETGVVVYCEKETENIKFGKIGTFAEETFELLPEEEYVRLSN